MSCPAAIALLAAGTLMKSWRRAVASQEGCRIMKRVLLVPILMAALLLLVLGGCASSPAALTGSSPATAASTSTTDRPACLALAKINTGLNRLSNTGEKITVGEVKTIQAQISLALNAISKVAPSNSDVSATIDNLKAANDKIGQAVEGLPDGDTLGQHSDRLQQFKAQVASAQASVAQLANKLNCTL